MKNQKFVASVFWWGPLFLFLIFTPFSADWDLTLSRFAYRNHQFSSHSFFYFFYDWGGIPALSMTAFSLIVLILGLFFRKLRAWRKEALYLFLTFTVGAGLITNVFFKDHWGRPRPKQVVEFGGMQEFRPFYSPQFDPPEPSKSFPCGHCTTGFYFFCFVFLGKRLEKRWLERLGWCLAFGLGMALSTSRIFQGGHFLSDTIAGAIVMWYTALILDWLLYSDT